MNRKDKGFTLIEVLVAITILSILTLTLYTVFKSGVDAWSKSEARLDIFQNARVVLDQISRELPGAIVGGVAEFKGEDGGTGIPVPPDTIEFVAIFGGSTYQIKYLLDEANKVLVRRYDENPEDFDNPVYVDIDFGFNISNINFDYWDLDPDGDPNTDDAAWTTNGTWSKTSELPGAVWVKIELQDLEDNVFPFETIVYLPSSEQ